ncbi:MAG: alpha/beta fold hydrolase [Dehalococcoidia bacterium]
MILLVRGRRAPRGAAPPGGIADIGYLTLGGLQQWVMIRGESVDNPPLILLHGGPGFSETPLFREFNAPLERDFTLVYWDQRGSGKSYHPAIPPASMTVERCIADLDELVDAVRGRLHAERVTLFGHSWGSALGVLYAARFPHKVAAYVGSGQVADWPAAEAASYDYAIAEAARRSDERTLRALREIGPPPHTARQLWTERTSLQRLEGNLTPAKLWAMGQILLGSREYSLLDLLRLYRGFRSTLDLMWSEVSALDLNVLAPALEVPVFFFLGRHDHWVPPEVSVAYFDRLTAPSKQLLWFEASGHEPFADEPSKFNASMVELVRPLAA